MTGTPSRTLFFSIVLILLLAACSGNKTPQAVDEPAATSAPVVEPTSSPQQAAAPLPTVTPEPTATPEPIATLEPLEAPQIAPSAAPGVATLEAILAGPPFTLGELETYLVESTGLTFDYPAGWVITDDESGLILIESEAGYGDRVETDAGAMVSIILKAPDDIYGQDSLEKLASYILASGMSPSTRLGDPTTMMLNNQELTFSAFVDQSRALEGVYAAFLTDDDLAVVLAVASGANRVSFRPAVETIVDSLILRQAE